MLKLLAFLWSGCWHKWRRLNECITIRDEAGRPTDYAWRYECERCGIVKAFRE